MWDRLMRTLVDLPEPDVQALDEIGRRRRVSRAKVIRQAVGEYLARNAEGDVEAAFGLWRDQAVDGLDYQRRAREEW
jgi:metal-responsive CopG/Arc/MetJ family transcriptional regulator